MWNLIQQSYWWNTQQLPFPKFLPPYLTCLPSSQKIDIYRNDAGYTFLWNPEIKVGFKYHIDEIEFYRLIHVAESAD